MDDKIYPIEFYERILMDHNDDDWYVPDGAIDFLNEKEYKMYLSECQEECIEYEDYDKPSEVAWCTILSPLPQTDDNEVGRESRVRMVRLPGRFVL